MAEMVMQLCVGRNTCGRNCRHICLQVKQDDITLDWFEARKDRQSLKSDDLTHVAGTKPLLAPRLVNALEGVILFTKAKLSTSGVFIRTWRADMRDY